MNADYRVLQEAAHWFAVLQSGSASAVDRQAWHAWLREPQHALAWQRVERISGQFQPLADDRAGRAASRLLQQRQPNRRQALKMLSLVGGGALALSTGLGGWQEWSADQRTAVGEVRDLRLADGSQLWLNTDSAVDVSFDRHVRQLSLLRGELLLDTPEERRPLLLRTAEGRVQTRQQARFAVRQHPGLTQLDVFAGMVEIQPTRFGAPQTIASGQQATFGIDFIRPAQPVQAASQAWANGVLLADNQRLEDFVAELGRYRRGYIGCDPRIADLRVVGAFPLADTERVLDALESTLPLRINRRLPWWISLEPSGRTGDV
ncbi:FecR domain-containing protein [Stutzerimonas sp. NM35]